MYWNEKYFKGYRSLMEDACDMCADTIVHNTPGHAKETPHQWCQIGKLGAEGVLRPWMDAAPGELQQ